MSKTWDASKGIMRRVVTPDFLRGSEHMPQNRTDRAHSEPKARRVRLAISAVLFTVLVIAILTLAGIGARYWTRGDFNVIHALLILFLSINLVICYWEVCLFLRRDYIEQRTEYWRKRWRETEPKTIHRIPYYKDSVDEGVVADGMGGCLGDVFPVRRFLRRPAHIRLQRRCCQRLRDPDPDVDSLRRLHLRYFVRPCCGHRRSDAVLAVDVHDLSLLGQLLLGQSANPDQPRGYVHLHLGDEFSMGAFRATGTLYVSIRLIIPERQLQKSTDYGDYSVPLGY